MKTFRRLALALVGILIVVASSLVYAEMTPLSIDRQVSSVQEPPPSFPSEVSAVPNIRTTVWSPDTSDAILEFQWDANLPEESRTHTLVRVIKPSSAHPGLNGEELHRTVLEENVRKNKAFAIAKDVIPTLEGEDYQWSFDTKRNLQISFPKKNLNRAQKAQIQAALDMSFGPGKVRED